MGDTYGKVFRRVLYPAYESVLRRRGTLRHLREYEDSQWLSGEEIAALQWRRLERLLDHCFAHVPYYRRRWAEAGAQRGDIASFEDFARLPVLTKQDIRTHFEDLRATTHRGRLFFKTTGGSTGEPLKLGYCSESAERRQAVMWRGYGWSGYRMGDRAVYLWGAPLGPQPLKTRLKDAAFHAAFGRRMLNAFTLSQAQLRDYVDAYEAYRPRFLVGYVGAMVRLAQWIVDEGRRVHAPQAVLSAAEALLPFQRELIERAFGAPVYNTYGCREFMLIAAECEHRDGLHLSADHLRVELVDTETTIAGEPGVGQVAITDLHNFGMPFVRYLNGDMAVMADDAACACGRGLPRLSRIEGRRLDVIRTPDGGMVPGEFFPHLMKDYAGIARFQIVQRTLDSLDISLVPAQGFDPSQLDGLEREIRRALGERIALRFHTVDALTPERSGKLRVTRSELG